MSIVNYQLSIVHCQLSIIRTMNYELPPAKTDVAVLILFFNRPQHLQEVFDEVRRARPSRLFLYQDGPRDARDLPGIEACRRIVEQIDWQCEVHTKYQERNYGCDRIPVAEMGVQHRRPVHRTRRRRCAITVFLPLLQRASRPICRRSPHLDDLWIQYRRSHRRHRRRLFLHADMQHLGMGLMAACPRHLGRPILLPR